MHARTILPALLALATTFTQGATEFGATAPVELVSAMTRGGVIYQDALPENFPPFALPDGILLMGSIDSGNTQQALFRTAMSGAASQEAMASALQAEGWQPLADSFARRRTGFVMPTSTAATPAPLTLCHDEFGNLQIRGEDGSENRIYVRRSNFAPAAQRPSCEEQNLPRGAPGGFGALPAPTEIMHFVPALRSPPQFDRVPRPIVGITGLGSTPGFGINSVLRAPGWSIEEVREHYDAQIREQGWVPEAQWSGTATAGSHWTRRVFVDVQTELPLYLTFTAFHGSGDDFSMALAVSFRGFTQ